MSRMCGGDYNVLEVFVEGRVKSPEESIVSPVVARQKRQKVFLTPRALHGPSWLCVIPLSFSWSQQLRDTAERWDASASADGNMIC